MESLDRLGLFRAIALLACITLVASCSQVPPEPAPEFTLPLSQVSTAPPSPEEAAATASAPNRLRYVAVPPGQQVEGMAHARIVVKHKKATRHRRRHAQKAIAAPAAAIKQQTGAAEPGTKP
jgi:hypothetical protein